MADKSPTAAPPRLISFRRWSPRDALRDIVTGMAYHKWPVLIAFLVPCTLGLVVGLRSKPVFTAQARMLVLYAADYVFHPGDHGTGNDITLDRNQIIQAELGILQSPALASQTVAAVGAEKIYPGLEEKGQDPVRLAAERLATDLTVTSVPQSNMVELSLRGQSRDVAIETLGTLIARYLPYRSSVFEKSQTEKAGQERAQFADRLHAAEETLARFALDHGITNLDTQTSLLLQQKNDNAREQSLAAQSLAEAGAKLRAVQTQLVNVPASVQLYTESTRSQQVSGLTDTLVKLQGQRQELRTRYRDDAPAVRDVERQIASLRQQIAASAPRDGAANRVGRNTVYDDLTNQEAGLTVQLRGLEARQVELSGQGQHIQTRIDELATLTQQYRELQRNRDVLDQSYRSISISTEQSQLANALERAAGANVRVVQPPDAPIHGRSQRALIIIGGVIVGLLAAAATLAILGLTRRVALSERDIERALELPVLASVAQARTNPRPAPRHVDAGLSVARSAAAGHGT